MPFYCELMLQFLWFMIDSMQIVNIFLYLNIVLPENVSKILFLFADANLYFFSNFLNEVFGIHTSNSNFAYLENPLIKAPEKFDDLGISSLYLTNAGALILMIILIYIMFLAIYLLDSLSKKMKLKNHFIKRTIEQMKKNYNHPLLIRLQSLFLMGIIMATCLQIRSFSTLSSEYFFNYIFAFLSVIYIAAYLYMIFKISNNEYTFFNDEEYLKYYSPIFRDSNMEIFLGRNNFLLTCIKKIIISITLIFLYDWPYMVFSFLLCLQLIEITLVFQYNFFRSKIMNCFMKFSEIVVFCSILLLLTLKIYFDCVVSQKLEIPEKVVQNFFILGWILIGVIFSLIFIYFILVNWSFIKFLKRVFQRCKPKYQNKIKYDETPDDLSHEISRTSRNENSKIL